ncbi:MAG: SDR family NAD(P)-dependent oxidoreductase [Myxococcota bacterium]
MSATLTGLLDQFSAVRRELPADLRLDGETHLVTGASRGLGLAIVKRLAARGARVVMVCRSRLKEAPAEVRAAVPHADLIVQAVDLTNPPGIEAMLDHLVDERLVFDRVICNAGMVPAASRTTQAGLDVMVHVNFVANVQLVQGLRTRRRFANGARLVMVGSDAHRYAVIDLENWDVPATYGTAQVLQRYGESKRLLHTWTEALAKRADDLHVLHLCPGAIATDIAREAPGWLRPLVGPVMRTFFPGPDRVASWVCWVIASPEFDDQSGVYFHLGREKPPGEGVRDPNVGTPLWESAQRRVQSMLQPEES